MYTEVTRKLSAGEIDVVESDEIKTDETMHPRAVITIRRANGIPYPYYVSTVSKILSNGGLDPFTGKPFSEVTKQRVILYKKAIEMFPEYTVGNLNPKDIYTRWKGRESLSGIDREKLEVEARAFLQVEDLDDYYRIFSDDNPLNLRKLAEEYLEGKENNSWIIRNGSVKSTEYNKVYVLSHKRGEEYRHIIIMHCLGEGFICGIDTERDMLISPEIQRVKFPTIIDLLCSVVIF